MPMDLSRYPADWMDISLRIRERAGWRCEWCGVPNGVWIRRHQHNPATYDLLTGYDGPGASKVILTVHHMGADHEDGSPGDRHDKHDVRDANLAALCQRCHFLADLDIHIANAAAARRWRRVLAGQLEMELAT